MRWDVVISCIEPMRLVEGGVSCKLWATRELGFEIMVQDVRFATIDI